MARSGRFGLVKALNYLAFAPLATRAPTYGRLLLSLLRDERIPGSRKAILGIAGAYLVSPIDIIPEYIPLLGALDDVAVIVVALDVFLEGIDRSILDEKLAELGVDPEELDRDLLRVRRMVPRPLRRLMMQLPDAIEGLVEFVRRSGVEDRVRHWVETEALPAARTGRRPRLAAVEPPQIAAESAA
jgi:uncharacterized membrane protein YkvA (DUF1232 family)